MKIFTDMAYIYVDGVGIVAGKNVTISGASYSYINHNSATGLYVSTPGNITLSKIEARSNGAEGAYLDNYFADDEGNPEGYGNVSVTGSNGSLCSVFNSNGWQGLVIKTNGSVMLNYLKAYVNGASGISVGNPENRTTKTITAKNLNIMSNGEDGLYLNGEGAILASNIYARGNGGYGAYLDNEDGIGSITLSGTNYMWENGVDGIRAVTTGSATISGVDARSNGGNGVYAVTDNGVITLNKVYVYNSYLNGIELSSNNKISLTGVSSFYNGFDEDGDGVYIHAYPTALISIKQSAFMGNGGCGIHIAPAYGRI